jgi:hypothetical protein
LLDLHDADIAAGAGTIDDQGGLAEAGVQARRDDARHHVGRPARRRRNDEADGAIGVGRFTRLRSGAGAERHQCQRERRAAGYCDRTAVSVGHAGFLL